MEVAAINKLDNKVVELAYSDAKFWSVSYNGKGEKIINIITPKLRQYLKEEGFKNYNNEAIHIVDNVAKKVTQEEIFKHTLKFIESYDNPLLEAAFIKQGESILIKNKAVYLGLAECEQTLLKDTEDKSYHNYMNGIVLVEDPAKTDNEIKILKYKELNSFIWSDAIIQRDFKILEKDSIEDAMFSQFLRKITNNLQHYLSLCSSIGYLLHKYKDQRKPICIIINDENLADEGKPQGGTGKGLVVKGITQIVEKAMYNGKNSDFSNNKFAYQNVKETTRLIFIDDVLRNYSIEPLFSSLTDDLIVEKKYKAVKTYPYEDSPKFVITTNYTIRGNSSSFKRRRFDVFLNSNYTENHTPVDDFKCEFFHGWDKSEWQKFDFFMMGCLSEFLNNGLQPYESNEIKLKMLKNETSSDFCEFMDIKISNATHKIYKEDFREQMINNYGEKYNFLNKNHKTLKDWLSQYAEYKNINIKQGRDSRGTYIEFDHVDTM